ncbi:hypothetical protein Sjap_011169 [Stephania japonica]|uniref:F-box domain-containing protein n=1 Tax=Stephania japonica TaxID=461633 RepID=A0AAP0JCZ4_9MAGN
MSQIIKEFLLTLLRLALHLDSASSLNFMGSSINPTVFALDRGFLASLYLFAAEPCRRRSSTSEVGYHAQFVESVFFFGFSGNDGFRSNQGSLFGNLTDAGLLLSLGQRVDLYIPPCKRSRITAPFHVKREIVVQQPKKPSIDVLPDECLYEILRRLPGSVERSACASVSKRWLMLLSSIHSTQVSCLKSTKIRTAESGLVVSSKSGDENSSQERIENEGYLSRCLEGKKATDVRLAAIAVGTATHGGLGKLTIRGTHSTRGVTNSGLSAIARGCPSLKALTLWNVPSVGDDGLREIASNCRMLEKLDLCQCPEISGKGLAAIAKGCPNLTSLTIDSCPNIDNEGLQAIGKLCSKLESVAIKNCRVIGDQGIATLLSSTQNTLLKIKLQDLEITDVSLAVLGHYGRAVTDLVLTNLQKVSERGFWAMGNAHGLQKLESFTVTSCEGLSDVGLEEVGNGCPNIKQMCLRKCASVSDRGMVAFAKNARSLKALRLEECHRVTQTGVVTSISICKTNFKALSLVKCFGITDDIPQPTMVSACKSLRSLTIQSCPGFGSKSLAMVGMLCPQLQHVELSGLGQITDIGLLPLVENCEAGLVKVNLSGCLNLTDAVVCKIAKLHGETLQVLNLDGCRKISDRSLVAIAKNCSVLNDLDVSKSGITDFGVIALCSAKQLSLEILSISGCCRVSDTSVPYLGNLGLPLAGLNVVNCNLISRAAIDMLVEQLWSCDVLS